MFDKLCTPLKRSPLSSAVFVELIQFAEKQTSFIESCKTPQMFNRDSASAILVDASGFSKAMLGFSPIPKTCPE